jgi:protein SCO1
MVKQIRRRVWKPTLFLMGAAIAMAQPGNLTPIQQSLSLQDKNLKPNLPEPLKGVGIDQKLGSSVPMDLLFRDEAGRSVPLRKYFESNKPVLLVPVYFRCPMLCTQILSGVASSLKAVAFNPGQDFEIVAFSFDPKDTPEDAASKKDLEVRRYGRANTANGWHFLTGDEASIQALTDAIGFHYKYDSKSDQYVHASGVMLATPSGQLSHYFYGVEYAPRDLRLGLVEASLGKIGSSVDQMLLFCFHYDPATGKYGAVVMNMVRFAGAGFALLAGMFLLIAFRREARSNPNARRAE